LFAFLIQLITLHRSHFEATARALIAFDVVDKNHSGHLPLRDLQTLLWLTQGSEPSQALLTQQTDCFEALCLNKSISRLQFARQACIDAAGGGFEA
jgi:Ca2+-binding EF-hand superfamily protein